MPPSRRKASISSIVIGRRTSDQIDAKRRKNPQIVRRLQQRFRGLEIAAEQRAGQCADMFAAGFCAGLGERRTNLPLLGLVNQRGRHPRRPAVVVHSIRVGAGGQQRLHGERRLLMNRVCQQRAAAAYVTACRARFGHDAVRVCAGSAGRRDLLQRAWFSRFEYRLKQRLVVTRLITHGLQSASTQYLFRRQYPIEDHPTAPEPGHIPAPNSSGSR